MTFNYFMNHLRKKHRLNAWVSKMSKRVGPGLITGAADDDPSGIVTYSNIGAQFHYGLLWLAFYCYPLMVAVQEICARIGWVTGQGISTIIKKRFSAKIYYPLIFIFVAINVFNIGADLLAMSGVAGLLVNAPRDFFMFFFALVIIGLEIFLSYRNYSKFLRYLCLFLLAYPISAILAQPGWGEVIKSLFVPIISSSKMYLLAVVAFLGTTISPYLFFWQSSEEVEDEIDGGKINGFGEKPRRVDGREIRKINWDTRLGMFISEIITIFIIVAAGRILFESGIHNIETAQQAAMTLVPLVGQKAMFLFSLGIIGTGLLAIPVLAGASAYALSEAFNQKEGLYLKLNQAKFFYGIIVLSILIALMANFLQISSMVLLYWTAIINGLITPFILLCLMIVSNDKKIMGSHTNTRWLNILGWTTTVVMVLSVVGLIFLSI
ncbi:MAG TPA: divalent metal cation transporter [Candidatus Portnoybacteria bacterium]|nr:divalent metal cation transporter [Candidatus Portnoybacteria bacterium]